MALAKTTRPTLAGTVERSRLFRLLDRAGRQPVTWVWAPAGSGKTTLVASYLTNRRIRPLWYRIDEGDADVATFFYYLGRAAPRRRRSLPLLTPEYRQGLAAFTRRFFRDLYSRLGRTSTVVFDNYQDVPPDSALHGVMVEALDEIPKGGRVIVISRSEPPGSFARLRAHQRIKTLDWSHVRFTLAEATALVRKLVPGRWSPAAIRALHTTADGWCAGLVLRCQHLRSEGRDAKAVTAVSSDVLFDYFADEIFKKADAPVQDVLLQTAFLPGVTPSMAIALTGRHDAGEILARLHHQNYFTNKQSGTEATYTYHPLFREFLLSRAGRAYPQERRTKLRRVAASLLDGAGQIEAASRLLREVEDWEGLAQMVHRHASTLLVQGRAQTVEDWLTHMPASIIEEQPWLAFWRAIGVFGETECQRDLQQAFHSFRRHEDALGMFQAWSAIVFAYETVGESVPMDRWIAQLDDIMRAAPGFPSKGAETRVAGAMLGAISMRQPHHPDGTRWAERAIELVRSHPDPSIRAITVWNWIHFELQRGDLSKAAAMIDEMRAFLPTRDASPVFAVNASATVAW